MHIFFQNDVVMTTTVAFWRNAIPCYTDNTEKKVLSKRTQTPGKFKLHIYRTITNTNRKRQIEIYIYTNKQTNKQETKKQIKQKYIFIYLS